MIDVINLQFTYPKAENPAVRGVDFHIEEGEIFGFLGPSGAGKSTTQKILIKLLEPFQGQVTLMGKSLQDWDRSFYNHIGVGFELPNHYKKLSAVENLRFFGAFYNRKVRDPLVLLDLVGLKGHANKKVSDFSKGMKMRLNFVRAIMHDPVLLFLDEPTAGLDPVNARIMKDIILDLKAEGKTIFITTHNMHDADELCDRIALIIDGRLALVDSPKALKLRFGQRRVKVEFGSEKTQRQEFELDGLGHNQEFLSLLKDQPIQTIHTEEASLEDIFIKVTGKNLSANS